MFTFNQFNQLQDQVITEDVQAIKTHLSHLEDLAVEKGKAGFDEFQIQVENIIRQIKGLQTQQQVNLKVDGSMMLLFGADPRPNFKGMFFVATKSGLNSKNPKVNHSLGEIGKNYPDYELAEKLKSCLIHLRKIYDNSGHIFQCDVLFCLPKDKKYADIDGQNYLIFTPNTITYAIPADEQSPIYQKVKNARVGVVIHEILKGEAANNGKAILLQPKTRDCEEYIQSIKNVEEVFAEGSNYKKIKFKCDFTLINDIEEHLALIKFYKNSIDSSFDTEYLNAPVLRYIKQYLNKQVEFSNGGIFGAAVKREKFSFDKFLKGFKKYLIEVYGKEALKRKTKRGKDNVSAAQTGVVAWLDRNSSSIESILTATYHMLYVKNLILKLFKQVEKKLGKTFIQQVDGSFVQTGDEGLVLFCGNSTCKIVDRLDFSRANRRNNRLNSHN